MSAARIASPSSPRLLCTKACSASSYAFLQHFVRAESGIVIDDDKRYLLETRLLPVARKHGLASLDGLSAALAGCPGADLRMDVIEAMTTNETLFFRDSSLFDALKTSVLPYLFDAFGRTRKIRIWSAAASSGQEAYSLAMTLSDMGKTPDDVEILGTDLAHGVLDRARRGRYGQFEVSRGLPSRFLPKYFSRTGQEWEVNADVKKFVRFEQLDLRKNFSFLGRFDLILCRNVLIYFDARTKTGILDALRAQLAPAGFLALGCAETVINVHSGFRRTTFSQAAFYTRSNEI